MRKALCSYRYRIFFRRSRMLSLVGHSNRGFRGGNFPVLPGSLLLDDFGYHDGVFLSQPLI
jgi:hypothetical protein